MAAHGGLVELVVFGQLEDERTEIGEPLLALAAERLEATSHRAPLTHPQ